MKTLSRFVTKFTSSIVAVLSCFDRVILARESSGRGRDLGRPAVRRALRPARGHRGAARPGRRIPTRDGRQLLGWASKQIPDLKGVLIGYGKKKGLHSKIVEWTPQQVAAAYRFARTRAASTR